MKDIREVQRVSDEDGLDLLVLPEGHKRMVKSLVKQHFREKGRSSLNEEQTDLVRGKGRCLASEKHAHQYNADPLSQARA